ncbi:DUF4231 domain-containing protein [Fulvivirgaceae bacterium BMA10]|uniref:DUF4231 domain-containing protein n=1 Tax=Splendidivirga corallicola TaxID=3051826 RepID=A0ABT8KT25_9BACT|nr:DUF4231 domain-containing protein [Fulvivirgaceae bacterium BMA10]
MENSIAVFEKSLNESISQFSKQRGRMFKIVRYYKYSIVGLTALSTIVLGLQIEDFTVYQKNIALVIGTVVTALTTLSTFWNVEEYWLQNKVIEQQLKSLKYKFEFDKSEKLSISKDRLLEFSRQFQEITNQQQTYWKGALEEISEASDNE